MSLPAPSTTPIEPVDLVAFTHAFRRLPRLGDPTPPWAYRGWLLPYVIALHGVCPAVANRWDEAKAAFNSALEISPGDGPSLALLARVDQLAADPPADWDGAWQMEHK